MSIISYSSIVSGIALVMIVALAYLIIALNTRGLSHPLYYIIPIGITLLGIIYGINAFATRESASFGLSSRQAEMPRDLVFLSILTFAVAAGLIYWSFSISHKMHQNMIMILAVVVTLVPTVWAVLEASAFNLTEEQALLSSAMVYTL